MCTSVDSLFTDLEAGLAGVETVAEAVDLAIPAPVVSAIVAAVSIAETGLSEVKTLYDQFEADNTDTGLVGDIQNAISTLENNINGILTAAHIDNATLQTWITKVVNLASTVCTDIVDDILPDVTTSLGEIKATGKVDWAKASAIRTGVKQIKKAYETGYDAALASSGLPADVTKTVHDNFHHAIARHLLGARV